MSIPKVLHQIWVGSEPMSPLVKNCVATMNAMHPEWTRHIHRDFSALNDARLGELGPRVRHFCFEVLGKLPGSGPHSTLAMQADMLRLVLLYLNGGFYVDADMWAVRPLDKFAEDSLVLMRIAKKIVGEGLIAAPPLSDEIRAIMEWFMSQPVMDNYVSMGLHELAAARGWRVYPTEYFCPHSRFRVDRMYRTTENTHTVHCWKQHNYSIARLRRITFAASRVRV